MSLPSLIALWIATSLTLAAAWALIAHRRNREARDKLAFACGFTAGLESARAMLEQLEPEQQTGLVDPDHRAAQLENARWQ